MDDERKLDRELNDLVRELEHLSPDLSFQTELTALLYDYALRITNLEAQVKYLADKLDKIGAR